MIIEVGSGPVGGPTSKDGAGFSSVDAIRYAGAVDGRQEAVIEPGRITTADPDTADQETSAEQDLQPAVAAGDRLRYLIYPALDAPLGYQATYAALDLRFDDGSRLSELDVTDQYQMPATAAGQGEAKILYCDQWNDVQIDLTPAVGRRVSAVLLVVDPPAADHGEQSVAGKQFEGWIDDIEIGPAPADPDVDDLVGWVDTRRGTNASGGFSRGNNLPITAWPNGFNFLTPVTDASTNRWPYEYQRANNADNRPQLQGISFSHQPSPWMGDRNQLSVMPSIQAEPLGDPVARSVSFSHDSEIARPDLYSVRLDNGVLAQLAPTDHGAIFHFDFPAGAPSRQLIFDTVDDHGSFSFDGEALRGWVDNGSPRSESGMTRMYCYGVFSAAPASFGPTVGGRTPARAARFGEISELTLRIATSFIGVDQARHNLELELAGRDFEAIRTAAADAWNERLAAIRVAEATAPQRRTLYGCLYRLNLYPNSQFENVGSAEQPDFRYASPVITPAGTPTDELSNAVIKSGKCYVNNGFWDTYRTAWPAYAFLYPELAAELADGFIQQYRDGGWIARWSSPGYADCMTGTSSDVAFADAFTKGVALPDPLAGYDAGLRNATVDSPETVVGRKGLDRGIFAGFVDTDTDESVSWTLEGYINDFGLAELASRLADAPTVPAARRDQLREEAAYFYRRAQNYQLLFDPKINFFQGRRPDGTFAQTPEDFDPCAWGGDFTETDGWNFAFHVPHDGRGLAWLYGGRDGLEAKLDAFFSTPEKADRKGTYRIVIHEMVEARAVRMGQYGFSNQPAHHIAHLYNYTAAPDKAQRIAREVLQRLFVGEQIGQGYPGDEDNGEMSAWYLFAALGLYPLRVGSPDYAVSSPLFARAEIHPQGRAPIVVTAQHQARDNHYIQAVTLNGQSVNSASIDADALAAGGTLDFVLGPEPSGWATGADDQPPSLTTGERPAAPLLDLIASTAGNPEQAGLFDDNARTEVALSFDADQECVIDWSLDAPARAAFYTLTSGAGNGDPRGWRLEGSNDGSDWTVLDTRTDQSFTWRRQTRPFALADGGAYRHYRLVITAADPQAALSEIELLA